MRLKIFILSFLFAFNQCHAMDELANKNPTYIKVKVTKNFGYGWYDNIIPGNLYFYYGNMGAGKSALIINKVNEFTSNGVKPYLYIPKTLSKDKISSRNGKFINLQKIDLSVIEPHSILIIDEAQFLSKGELETIKSLLNKKVTVFCFGLLTTFEKNLFDASKSLIDISSVIREIPMLCENCKSKNAVYNFRLSSDANLVLLDKKQYKSLCKKCFEDNHIKKIISGLIGTAKIGA